MNGLLLGPLIQMYKAALCPPGKTFVCSFICELENIAKEPLSSAYVTVFPDQ